jgi:hypothetical protein
MPKNKIINFGLNSTAGIFLCLFAALTGPAWAAPLTPGEPISLPGTTGGFDFIRLDGSANRLLLGHEGNKSFDIFDIGTGKLLKVFPACTSQDAAVDTKNGLYFRER